MGADWEEEYAYSLGIQRFIWGFPWILLSQLAWLWTSPEGKVVMEKGDTCTLGIDEFVLQ